MIHRELEQRFATRIAALTANTALVGTTIRHGVPESDLGFPCLIIAATGSELIEGGVRNCSRVNMDFTVISAASATAGWQTTHKNRVAALTKILDDTNTSASISAINSAQTDFTLYGWAITDIASEISANHQSDLIRISVVAGDRVATAQTGPTSATPQDFSLRHELEEILSSHLAAELPELVTDDYAVVPYYNESAADASRIVSACLSATKPFPQLDRYQVEATVHVITSGIDSTGHVAATKSVQAALRSLTTQDFTSADLTVAGVLEASHSQQKDANKITDVLGLSIWCQVN
jgi:hypothetical protein